VREILFKAFNWAGVYGEKVFEPNGGDVWAIANTFHPNKQMTDREHFNFIPYCKRDGPC